MPSSVNKGYELQATGSNTNTWGIVLNEDVFEIVDRNIGGLVSKSLTNVNVTLTAEESQNLVVRLTGALSGAVEITTAAIGMTIVENLTTNAFAVTFTNGVGTPVTLVQGARNIVITDGTNGPRLLVSPASTAIAGSVELATDAETQALTDTARAVTPSNLAALTPVDTRLGLIELATNAEVTAGTDAERAVTPASLQQKIASDTALGIQRNATKAEMEAAASTTLSVTAGRQIAHPMSPKAWVKWTPNSTTIHASAGVSSITNVSSSISRVNFSTAFTTANYGISSWGKTPDNDGDAFVTGNSSTSESTTNCEFFLRTISQIGGGFVSRAAASFFGAQ